MALDVLVMEHFIETVKRFPCLWKTTAIEYRDLDLKEAAWNEVVKETNLGSVKVVKNKWKKLRDSYRDALKRQSDMMAKDPANAMKKPYPWKYMEIMSFLQPHMTVRPKKLTPYELQNYQHSQASLVENENGQNQNGVDNHTTEESEDESESPRTHRKRKNSEQLLAIDRKLDFLCKSQNKKMFTQSHYEEMKRGQPQAQQAVVPVPDPLDNFFYGMCQSTKRLPFPMQIKIKKILFNAVIEAEETLMIENYASWPNDAASSSSSNRDDEEEMDEKQQTQNK